MDQPILSLIQIFQIMLKTEIKHEFLTEKYHLMKMDENLVEEHCASIVFCEFAAVLCF